MSTADLPETFIVHMRNGVEYDLYTADQLRAYGDKRAREAVEALLSPAMLEVGRKAIEDALIECRDARISVLARNNGLVVKERDGTPSDVIRMGPETALGIALRAMAASPSPDMLEKRNDVA